ncbi:Methyltransferase N6AMT1 [Frankliniella fusca]|uniref:Methyltransferase HEMK2 n=1 Tax=Frankliniella fusca TaxID=407009 RepID=A0AAE1GXE8_9NEOP|nr:Methyltransferase N6AMT1 [Frankliniella fusca]
MEAVRGISDQELIETPDLSHLDAADYDKVYEPREDSFLFLDALEKDLNLIRLFKPSICLEVGSGSGVICTALARFLGSSSYVIATDLNPFACQTTHQTAEANNSFVSCIQMDLDSMLRMNNTIDLLLFNPPYVVTTSKELRQPREDGSFLHLAWAGGVKGREVTDRLLSHVGQLLSHRSLFYLVVIKENDPEEICNVMACQGFKGEIIASRKVRNELLSVMRFKRGW